MPLDMPRTARVVKQPKAKEQGFSTREEIANPPLDPHGPVVWRTQTAHETHIPHASTSLATQPELETTSGNGAKGLVEGGASPFKLG